MPSTVDPSRLAEPRLAAGPGLAGLQRGPFDDGRHAQRRSGPAGCSKPKRLPRGPVTLLHVSYDPTRELWKAVNAAFTPKYLDETGVDVTIKPSHGGASSQARNVIDGLEADVVSLPLPTDTEAIARAGLIKEGWEEQFPNQSLPYTSTIVFVVRKGNPKQIKDWPDLVQDNLEIVTPSPKTSGNGKLSFLAAWGSVLKRGGSEDDAKKFVTELYKRVPVLDSGARAATVTFSKKGIGDVHLTWESEAFLEIQEAGGELELVVPSVSILAEPRVAVVDANVDRHGTRKVAEDYVKFFYTRRGAEDHRRELLPPDQSRRAGPISRTGSRRWSCSRSKPWRKMGRRRPPVFRRQRRVRRHLLRIGQVARAHGNDSHRPTFETDRHEPGTARVVVRQ